MRPAARLQASIELLDQIIIAMRDDGASADTIIKKYFKNRRYAGSKDRRAIRELVYAAIRRFGERPSTGRSAMLGLADADSNILPLFDGSEYGPAIIDPNEKNASELSIPDWIQRKFASLMSETEQGALLDRADLHIRLKPGDNQRAKLTRAFPDAKALPLENAFGLPNGTRVEDSALYQDGQLEIQDMGSQAIITAAVAHDPTTILDLCAGAGGKALAMAALLNKSAKIIAGDVNRNRLSRMIPRIKRTGAPNIETTLLHPDREMEALSHLKNQCDLVVVDAPCSGTGTWRRNPELRWRMTPKRLRNTTELQNRLLHLGGEFVAKGGRLVYAVCSLLDEEGPEQISQFLQFQSEWRDIEVDLPIGRPYRKGILLSPYHDGTDGFYFSCLEKL